MIDVQGWLAPRMQLFTWYHITGRISEPRTMGNVTLTAVLPRWWGHAICTLAFTLCPLLSASLLTEMAVEEPVHVFQHLFFIAVRYEHIFFPACAGKCTWLQKPTLKKKGNWTYCIWSNETDFHFVSRLPGISLINTLPSPGYSYCCQLSRNEH